MNKDWKIMKTIHSEFKKKNARSHFLARGLLFLAIGLLNVKQTFAHPIHLFKKMVSFKMTPSWCLLKSPMTSYSLLGNSEE